MKKIMFTVLIMVMSVFAGEFNYQYYGGFYDNAKGNPKYVHYVLSSNQVIADVASRTGITFWKDYDIGTHTTNDYVGSGYDRGHMVPAEDMDYSALAMKQSFSMANVAPQSPRLNRGAWSILEKAVRDSTLKWGQTSIWTGPLYRYSKGSFNGITVPSHFFKVICNVKYCWAYIYENNDMQSNDINSHITTISTLQTETGLIFR